MAAAVVAGSTGLVGSNILTQLLAHPAFTSVYAYTRRDIPGQEKSDKLHAITSTDSAEWPKLFPREQAPKILLSGLGTTRSQAGGLDAQRKIDYDLNLALAKSAKEAGVETYVLISTQGANAQSKLAYPKMKGELEEAVKAIGFKHVVLVRPGLIVGERPWSRPAEVVLSGIVKGLRTLTPALTNGWSQDAGVIARAAISAGVQCIEGKREPGVWILDQAEIISLGKE